MSKNENDNDAAIRNPQSAIRNPEVVVIGGGLAGVVAALRAADEGARVTLVHAAPGATAMHSGMFDVDTDIMRPRRINTLEDPSLENNLRNIKQENPFHPYANANVNTDIVAGAIAFFRDRLAAGKLELAGGLGDWLLIGNTLGTLKRTRLCLDTMAAGDVSKMSGATLLVAGPAGLDGFHAPHAARMLKHTAGLASPGAIKSAAGEILEWPDKITTANLTPFHAAQLLENESSLKLFLDQVAALVSRHAATHVAFPPILGINNSSAIRRTIKNKMSIPCFELAATPPSVPGARLQHALEMALRQAGICLVSGKVKGVQSSGNKVISLDVELPNKNAATLSAPAFVLASGKFIAGGLKREDALVETIFDLPVFYRGKPARDTFMYDLLTPRIAEKQPIFSCGVSTDSQLRPVNERGAAVLENLFCAGSVLAGYDALRDRCGSGCAVVTGYLAGQNAIKSFNTENTEIQKTQRKEK